MEIERFKSKLSRDQLQAIAIDTVRKQLYNVSEYDVYRFAKRLVYFAGELVKESEDKLKDVWTSSDKPADMNYTTGGEILDLNEFEYRKEIAEHLKYIDKQIKAAFKSDDPVFVPNIKTGEVLQVTKVSIKDYRKDSIRVEI